MTGVEDGQGRLGSSSTPRSQIPRMTWRRLAHGSMKGRKADLSVPNSSPAQQSAVTRSPDKPQAKAECEPRSNSLSKIPRAPLVLAHPRMPVCFTREEPSIHTPDTTILNGLTEPYSAGSKILVRDKAQGVSTAMDHDLGARSEAKPEAEGYLKQQVTEDIEQDATPEKPHHNATPSQSSDMTLNDDKTGSLTYADAVKEDLETNLPELDNHLNDVHQHEPPPDTEKIRWAPLNVPLKRRLQTLVVLVHCMGIATTVSIFFALCAIPLFWPLLLIYLVQVLSSNAAIDGSLRYRSERFRRSYIWHLFAGYFPAKLHKTHELSPSRKYILGYHPHGIISHGGWAAFASDALGFSEKFPGITNSLLTLDSNFRIPLYRDYIMAMGLRSVSKESITNILTKGGPNNEGMGRAVTIVIGGARESLAARPGKMRLVLKDRKGFIKIAIRTGADLVPVLAFGENDLYEQLPPEEHPRVRKFQMFVLKVWKFTLPFMYGRGIFNYDVGLMPFRRPLNIVVGAPIKVSQSDQPEIDEIDRLHELYVAELEKLWDRYKDKFAASRTEDMQIQ